LIWYWLGHNDRHYRLDKLPLVDHRRGGGELRIDQKDAQQQDDDRGNGDAK
jgi:hypothetical protein